MTEKKLNNIELEQNGILIPKGFFYVTGTLSNGCVIENNNGDQYVLVPEGSTTEGHHVGNRWVSRYEISKGDDGTPRSIAGKIPWNSVSYYEAVKAAESVGGYLLSKDEYSRICTWLVRERAASFNQMFFDGDTNGNYAKDCILMKTGSNPCWQHNHIFDFFGNGYTWTTEKFDRNHADRIIRGGHYTGHSDAISYPPTNLGSMNPKCKSEIVTFRIVLRVDEESEED